MVGRPGREQPHRLTWELLSGELPANVSSGWQPREPARWVGPFSRRTREPIQHEGVKYFMMVNGPKSGAVLQLPRCPSGLALLRMTACLAERDGRKVATGAKFGLLVHKRDVARWLGGARTLLLPDTLPELVRAFDTEALEALQAAAAAEAAEEGGGACGAGAKQGNPSKRGRSRSRSRDALLPDPCSMMWESFQGRSDSSECWWLYRGAALYMLRGAADAAPPPAAAVDAGGCETGLESIVARMSLRSAMTPPAPAAVRSAPSVTSLWQSPGLYMLMGELVQGWAGIVGASSSDEAAVGALHALCQVRRRCCSSPSHGMSRGTVECTAPGACTGTRRDLLVARLGCGAPAQAAAVQAEDGD